MTTATIETAWGRRAPLIAGKRHPRNSANRGGTACVLRCWTAQWRRPFGTGVRWSDLTTTLLWPGLEQRRNFRPKWRLSRALHYEIAPSFADPRRPAGVTYAAPCRDHPHRREDLHRTTRRQSQGRHRRW